MTKGTLIEPCKKAKKLMDQVERLAENMNRNVPAQKIVKIKSMLSDGTLVWSNLPGKIQHEFPGQFKGLTYNEIKGRCKKVGVKL